MEDIGRMLLLYLCDKYSGNCTSAVAAHTDTGQRADISVTPGASMVLTLLGVVW